MLAGKEVDDLVAQGAKIPSDELMDDDGMTAEERAELEAELDDLGELEDLTELEDASVAPAAAVPAPLPAPAPETEPESTAIGATAEAAHKMGQLERIKEARAAAFGKAEKAMLDGDRNQTAAWVSKVEQLDG